MSRQLLEIFYGQKRMGEEYDWKRPPWVFKQYLITIGVSTGLPKDSYNRVN